MYEGNIRHGNWLNCVINFIDCVNNTTLYSFVDQFDVLFSYIIGMYSIKFNVASIIVFCRSYIRYYNPLTVHLMNEVF